MLNEEELLALLTGTRHHPIVVCRIDRVLAELIGGHTTAVWLSRETAFKQEAKHHRADLELYLKAPAILASKHVRIQAPKYLIFIRHFKSSDGRLRSFRAAVKAAREGTELYLVSIHRQKRTDVRRTFERTMSIEDWKVRREVGPPRNPT